MSWLKILISYIIYCIVTLVFNSIFISLFHLFLFNHGTSFYFKEINVINLRLIQILFHSDGASYSADKMKICSKKGLVRQRQEQTNKPRKLVKLGNAGLLFLWYSQISIRGLIKLLQGASKSGQSRQLICSYRYGINILRLSQTHRGGLTHTHTHRHTE